jgi:phosphoserine phosphatase
MQNVLTLITDPARADISPRHVEAVSAALVAAGAEIAVVDWLDEGTACDVVFTGPSLETARRSVLDAIAAPNFDIAVQSRQGRRKDLLVIDMDSTVVSGETLDELADRTKVKDAVAEITARAMAGDLQFAAALRERVTLLAGLGTDAMVETAAAVRLNPGARTLVATMRAHGAYTVLVSGGFKFITSHVALVVGFDADEANRLEVVDGSLTGRIVEPILDPVAKLAALHRHARDHNIPLAETLAAGDGANDLAMIQGAGLGVAYHAKPILREAAAVRIDHGDLTALLYLQGYRGREFTL